MSLKAIITTLILGSSSLALAAPGEYTDVRDHRTEVARPDVAQQQQQRPDYGRDRDGDRDHREYRPTPRPMPVTLASSTRIQGRDVIRVNESLRPFTKLELRSNNGRTNLDKVTIVFGNGQTQVVECDAQLSGKQSFSIDLARNARNIKRIILVGSSGRRASVDVIAV